MPTPFPHHYSVRLARTRPSSASIAAGVRNAIAGGPPPEFGGTEERWSPEHLLLSSIGLCLLTTYEALAARAQLQVDAFRCEVEGILDKTTSGLAFTSFVARVEVESPDVELARTTLDNAKKHCIVSNALHAPVIVEPRFAATPRAA